ncbi:MAG TPA: M14 family zinc carboxypeptidase [Flavisolibacter sp.]|nr:M14 family zinc carboxypeptidase [Flavisolibacter sp.]
MKRIHSFFLFILFVSLSSSAQTDYFFPKATALDPAIPTPEKFLGYPIGSHYTRHDQIVAYFRELARVSNRVHVQTIGKTYEEREQIIATFTSADNYSRLEEIRKEHLTLIDPAKPLVDKKAPVIVHLGYSVHGNESSSGEVSLLTAYYLAASKDAETENWLKEAVIFIDPSLNPDGRDRAANWYNSYKSWPPIADPFDKEHQEGWPGGRTNHYFADLNRDWLNLVHVESRNRVKFFHQWYPNVQIDFHEQGSNATYYFEPTPKRHESPIIPQFLYEQNAVLAKYHAKALDEIGSLYFTKENYDNLSPIYGSTYPKFYGSVAATFEEASSRGLVTETTNGLLTFPFSIRNHLTTSFSTIRGAVAEKEALFKVQKNLFKYALEQGSANPAKAYVFGDSRDRNLTQRFLNLLLQHRVQVYEVAGNTTLDGKLFERGNAYIVPAEQPNFLIVHSLFETNLLKDSIYYDNTGWSVIHAYGLQYAAVNTPSFSKGALVTTVPTLKGDVQGGKASLAYLTSYTDYNASKALFALLQKGVLVKTAFKPFAAATGNGKKNFGYGSLVIPVAGQTISPDSLYKLVSDVAANSGVDFTAVSTGFSAEGIDLGSSNIKAVRKPEVAVVFGQGVNPAEAGQIWFLLNHQLGLPVVKIDALSLERAPLKRYNTLILPGGSYSTWNKATVDKIKAWVADGGTLVTLQNASAWAVQNELVKEKLLEDAPSEGRSNRTAAAAPPAGSETRTAAKPAQQTAFGQGGSDNDPGKSEAAVAPVKKTSARVDYVNQQDVEGARRINGAIFTADLDISHPLAFGITARRLFINKNSSTFLQPSQNKYATVAQYDDKPFVNGYSSKENIRKVSNSAAILLSPSGAGQVVLFADDPTYRSYWLGTNRIFLNSIFFAHLAGGYGGYAAEEEEEEGE